MTVDAAEHQIFDAAGNVIEDALDQLKAKIRNAACNGLDGTCIIELLHDSSGSTSTTGRRKLQASPSIDVSITREYDFGNSSTNVSTGGVADLLESGGIPVSASEVISLSASSTLTAKGAASESLMGSGLYTDAVRNELSTLFPELQANLNIVSLVMQPPALPPLTPPLLVVPLQPPSPAPMVEEVPRSNVDEAHIGASAADYVTFTIVGGVLVVLLIGALLVYAICCRVARGKGSFGTHRRVPKSSLQAAGNNGTVDELYHGISPGAKTLAVSANAPAVVWRPATLPFTSDITIEEPQQLSPVNTYTAEEDIGISSLIDWDVSEAPALNNTSAATPDEMRSPSLRTPQGRPPQLPPLPKLGPAGAATDLRVPPRVLGPPPARPPPARPPPAMAHLQPVADQRWADYQRKRLKTPTRTPPIPAQRFGTAAQVLPTSTRASGHHTPGTRPDAESTTAPSSSSQDKSDAESTISTSSTTSVRGAISLLD